MEGDLMSVRAEQLKFQAEARRLLDLMIQSVCAEGDTPEGPARFAELLAHRLARTV